MRFGKKKEEIIKVQQDKSVLVLQYKGTTFIYVYEPLWEGTSVGAKVEGSATGAGAGGSYTHESKRPIYHTIVFPSWSAEPMPYEKWKELAGYVASTQSGGAVMPDQIGKVNFPMGSLGALRAPSDLIKNRIRDGFRIYRRGPSPPDSVDLAFVASLANTIYGIKGDDLPPYYPLSEQDVRFELESMARQGEIRIADGKVWFAEAQYRS